jgi:hypothetical protein
MCQYSQSGNDISFTSGNFLACKAMKYDSQIIISYYYVVIMAKLCNVLVLCIAFWFIEYCSYNIILNIEHLFS